MNILQKLFGKREPVEVNQNNLIFVENVPGIETCVFDDNVTIRYRDKQISFCEGEIQIEPYSKDVK